VLVEAQDDQGDGLYIGNNGAASLPGVKVISNSWGGPEPTNAASYETYFNHPGISVFVASGDAGYTGTQSDYPSTVGVRDRRRRHLARQVDEHARLDRGRVVERR